MQISNSFMDVLGPKSNYDKLNPDLALMFNGKTRLPMDNKIKERNDFQELTDIEKYLKEKCDIPIFHSQSSINDLSYCFY